MGEPAPHLNGAARSRRWRNLRRRLVAWPAAALAAGLGRLPLPLSRSLMRSIGGPIMRRRLADRARENLRAAMGDRLDEGQQEAVLARMFANFALVPVEVMRYAAVGSGFLDRYVDDAEGLQTLHSFEQGWRRGWIGITGHLGNWELFGQWFKQKGLQPMAGILVKRQPNPHLNRVIERVRGRQGMATLYSDDSPRDLMRVLNDGGSIGFAPDQDVVTVAGTFVDFFGRPAYTPVGPARLALATGVPLMVGAALRTGDRFRVHLNAPIWPDFTRPRDEEVLRLTRAWSLQLEALIRDHPDQWAWFHRRWKTTPERLERRRQGA